MVAKYLPLLFGLLPQQLQSIVIAIYVYLIGIYFCVAEFIYDTCFPQARKPTIQFYRDQMMRRRKLCAAEEMPCAVVTGSSGTIGIEVLNILASLGFLVISIADRDPIDMDPDAYIKHISCDLNNAEEVKMIAEWINADIDHVELFIAAAGAIYLPTMSEMVESNSMLENQGYVPNHMETNICGNARLFLGIRHLMRNSIWSRSNAIFVSSCVSRAARRWDQILDKNQPPLNSLTAYADSKLVTNMFAMFAAKMQREFGEDSIDICAVHPAIVSSNIYKGALWPTEFIINHILRPFLRSGQFAANRVMGLVFRKKNGANGSYYEFNNEPVVGHCDQVFSEQLMNDFRTLLGLGADFVWAEPRNKN